MKTRRTYYLQILSVALLGLVASCTKTNVDSNSLYTPTNSNVTANATLLDLQEGRTLYISNCNSCHALVSPESYSPSEWRSIISKMAPRTNMSSSETTLVTKYVTKGN